MDERIDGKTHLLFAFYLSATHRFTVSLYVHVCGALVAVSTNSQG